MVADRFYDAPDTFSALPLCPAYLRRALGVNALGIGNRSALRKSFRRHLGVR